LPSSIAFQKLGRAHPRNGGGDVEHVMRDLAGGQVGLVQRGAGDEHVGIVGSGTAQHGGLDTVARHATQIQPVFQQAQRSGSGSMTVMSFCSETRLSATLSPTRPAPKIRIRMHRPCKSQIIAMWPPPDSMRFAQPLAFPRGSAGTLKILHQTIQRIRPWLTLRQCAQQRLQIGGAAGPGQQIAHASWFGTPAA
jgi:hypothetical protein